MPSKLSPCIGPQCSMSDSTGYLFHSLLSR